MVLPASHSQPLLNNASDSRQQLDSGLFLCLIKQEYNASTSKTRCCHQAHQMLVGKDLSKSGTAQQHTGGVLTAVQHNQCTQKRLHPCAPFK
jgi:hypothetical protein